MDEYKLVFGGGAVGKSAVTISFIRSHFVEEYDPTIENSYQKDFEVDNQVCHLDILDTAGQDEYSAMRDQYVKYGDAFLLMYAIDLRNSFNQISSYLELIQRYKEGEKVPIVLCGNKCDLENEREVPKSEGMDLASTYEASFLECSALQRKNIEELFVEMVTKVNKNRKPEKKKKNELKKLYTIF